MNKALTNLLLGIAAFFVAIAAAAPALAQSDTTFAPVRQFKDGNGVDLMTGEFTSMSPAVQIGDADGGLSFTREIRSTFQVESMLGAIYANGSTYTVSIGQSSEQFYLSGSAFVPVEQNGSTLTLSGNIYTYRGGDGAVATFVVPSTHYDFGNAEGISLDSITYPNGKKLTFYYTVGSYSPYQGITSYGRRLQSVTSNTGYQIKFTYEADSVSTYTIGYWMNVIQVMGLNDLVDSCSPSASACTPYGPRPTLHISPLSGSGSQDRDYTDSAGNTTHYDIGSDGITGIQLPGSSTDNVTVTYSNGRVSSVTAAGVATTYSYSDSGNVRTTTVTRGSNPSSIFKFDLTKLQLVEQHDEFGHVTLYQYDSSNRLTKKTMPEGNYVTSTYDSRGNITATTAYPKPGSGLSPITTTASYDSTCAIAVKCNEPNSATDARGNTTNYTYDATHGGVLTVTAPAAPNGVRPQIRYSYTRLDVNGSPSSSGIFRLTGISKCQTQASCTGTSDEVKAVLNYGQNQLLASKTVGAGDNSVLATNSATYDAVGNLLTIDGPLAGTADTTRYRYDADRRKIGITSPAPGNGQPMRATRITYRPDGQVSKQEIGTVASQSDADWANFTPLQIVDVGFDSNHRPITKKAVGRRHRLRADSDQLR